MIAFGVAGLWPHVSDRSGTQLVRWPALLPVVSVMSLPGLHHALACTAEIEADHLMQKVFHCCIARSTATSLVA